jgi:hypothetical protein
MAMPQRESGRVRQPWVKGTPSGAVRSKLPLEATFAVLKVCPYTLTGNGSEIVVLQSSQWFVVSVVPGVIVLPVVVLTE